MKFSREGKELTEIIGKLSGFFSCASPRGSLIETGAKDIEIEIAKP